MLANPRGSRLAPRMEPMTTSAAGPADAAGAAPIGPLVAPLERLGTEALSRARRQIVLPGFGEDAQRRLANARVLVVGAGGLGCASVPYLAGAGVGRIGIVDDDVVELSNLHRQTTHRSSDVGRAKVDALADAVARLDPAIRVDRHRLRLDSANARELFAEYDLVLDGSDNFPTRYLTNDAAQLTGVPLVWGAILQFSGQLGVAWHEHGPGYRDLFPVPPPADGVLDCAEGGVLPGLCGTIGSLMATEALKLIAGIGTPLIGRVLLYDALAARTRELTVRRDPLGAAPERLIDYQLFCGIDAAPPAEDARACSADAFAAEAASQTRSGVARTQPRVIDVRTAEEHDARRIAGSERIGVEQIEGGEIAGLGADRDAPLLVYCERDPRSVRAAQALAQHGFTDVRYLRGGIDGLARRAPELIERGTARTEQD